MRGTLRGFTRVVIVMSALLLVGPSFARATPIEARVGTQLAGLRLPFIANQGQVDARVTFYAPTFAGTLFVTRQGQLVYSLPASASGPPRDRRAATSRSGWTLTETLRGGRARPVGQDPSATGVSYFLGNDPARWRPKVATYDRLGLGEVWPGITVSLRARGRGVEKVFTVSPGASMTRIRVRLEGASALAVASTGDLVVTTGLGPVTFTSPLAYQERDGVRRPVTVAYRLRGREYGFTAAAYDPSLPLVIDPLLQATYLGGGGEEEASALAIHPATGDVYVAGQTRSADFPGTIGACCGQQFYGGNGDAFVARLTSTLTSLVQATYLGGSGDDRAHALGIHPITGDVYVAGGTTSPDFIRAGGFNSGNGDAFVARLTSSLTDIPRAVYLGGSKGDGAYALAIHPATGDVYVAGNTLSTDFPHTSGGAQPTFGGSVDAFVARLTSSLSSLVQATYLGGSGDDMPNALVIHPITGDVYVAGSTFSTDFPHTSGGAQPTFGGSVDAFVARLTSSLTSVTQATYLGGSDINEVTALGIHPITGDVYVAGDTTSSSFPHTGGGAQPTYGGISDTFVARLTFSLALVDPTLNLSASVNQQTFAVGQTLTAGGAVTNPGLPATADFYVGIVRPDGSIQFFTSTGIVLGNVANLASFQPLAVRVPLGPPFSVTASSFYSHQWTGSDAHGAYVFFVGAVKTGALAGGTLPSGAILGLATATFSFP